MQQERKHDHLINTIHAKYVKQHIQTPDIISQYCLHLFEDKQQNGVACALNQLSMEERQELIKTWWKSHPYLAAYYSSTQELREVLADSKDLESEFYHQMENWQTQQSLPKSLEHALKVKIILATIPEKANQDRISGIGSKERDYANKQSDKANALINRSSMHLSFRGALLYSINFTNLNLDGTDFTNAGFSHVSLSECTIRHGDMSGTQERFMNFIRRCDFTGVNFKGSSGLHFKDKMNFNNADLSEANIHIVHWCTPSDDLFGTNFRGTKLNKTQEEDVTKRIQRFFWDQKDYMNKNHVYNFAPAFLNPLVEEFTSEYSNKPLQNYLISMWLVGSSTKDELIDRIDSLREHELAHVSPRFRNFLLTLVKQYVKQMNENFIRNCSPYTKQYIENCTEKKSLSSIVAEMNLSPDEMELLKECCDPHTKRIMDIPVMLDENIYDLYTVLKFKGKDLAGNEFTPRDIMPSRKTIAKFETIINKIKDARAAKMNEQPAMEKDAPSRLRM